MTIEDAIVQYVHAWSGPASRRSAAETLANVLRTAFATVLGEDLAILTTAQVDELRARLGRRGLSAAPLHGRVRELSWRAGRNFIAWCVAHRLLTHDPLGPHPVRHLGELARRLRLNAGLTRRDLGTQTGLALSVLGRFETGRLHLSREELLRLLGHPAMAGLPDEAKAAGLGLDLGNNGVGKS